MEAGASTWVQDNIIKLSKQCRLFDGLEKDAEVLFQKLDQRRGIPMVSNRTQLVPNEVRNLIFDVMYKGGEPRSELRKGRRPSIGDQ